MEYDEVLAACHALPYREKLKLAHVLLQLAMKEEENRTPDGRTSGGDTADVQYVYERLLKLRPTKVSGVMNSIGAMFQFQGGISQADKDKLLSEMQRRRLITIDSSNRVTYSG